MAEHPEMTLDDVEVFRRKWICKSVVGSLLGRRLTAQTTSSTARLGFLSVSLEII